jgi:drug/metabolite transporter superfamily protein YnfA
MLLFIARPFRALLSFFASAQERRMTRPTAVLMLFLAALLEAGGDAVVRLGLRSSAVWPRAAFFVLAALLLFAYGWTVNRPPWDFGKLLGLYVVFFFVIAQLMSWLVFRQTPSLGVLAGGALIVAGGAVIALAH